jgi:hypothetical protein
VESPVSVPRCQRALHLDHRLPGPISLRHAPTGRAAPTSAACRPPLAGYGVHVATVPHPCRGDAGTAFTHPPLNTSSCIPLAHEAQRPRGLPVEPLGEFLLPASTVPPRAPLSFLLHHLGIPGLLVSPAEPQHHQSTHPRSRRLPLLAVAPSPFSRRSRRHSTILAPPLGHLEAP